MKLASYQVGELRSYGVVTDEGVRDIGMAPGAPATLLDALTRPDASWLAANGPTLALDRVRWLPPLWNNDRIICVGLNYLTHLKELGRDPPKHPMLFVRFADSLVGHEESIVRPNASECFDWEAELAVVIGTGGRHIPASQAMNHVFGYAPFNDGTLRDFQNHTSQFLPGKSFWRSGAFGPAIVTADEIPDLGGLEITAVLNGQVMQRATFDDLLFSVPDLIAYISTVMPLRPGDIIATGTTGGVGAARDPQVWMKAGDVIEIAIEQIGVLRNTVVEEADG